MEQAITATVHNPRVESVNHLDGHPENEFVIKFGNGGYNATVTVFVNDKEWDAIVAKVAAERALQKKESVPAS